MRINTAYCSGIFVEWAWKVNVLNFQEMCFVRSAFKSHAPCQVKFWLRRFIVAPFSFAFQVASSCASSLVQENAFCMVLRKRNRRETLRLTGNYLKPWSLCLCHEKYVRAFLAPPPPPSSYFKVNIVNACWETTTGCSWSLVAGCSEHIRTRDGTITGYYIGESLVLLVSPDFFCFISVHVIKITFLCLIKHHIMKIYSLLS
jgi:hypothetical protein